MDIKVNSFSGKYLTTSSKVIQLKKISKDVIKDVLLPAETLDLLKGCTFVKSVKEKLLLLITF